MSFFNEAYRGSPPWDIGRPQPDFEELSEEIKGKMDVVDLGCGTGEHSILFASKGHRVLGVDAAPLAIEKARAKAKSRRSAAEFLLADATDLKALHRTFDIGLDSGLFHVFSDADRAAYVRGLASIIRPGGQYFMLCFSDKEPDWGGPRRIGQDEIRDAFADGWKVDFIRPSNFISADGFPLARSWFSSITKAEK